MRKPCSYLSSLGTPGLGGQREGGEGFLSQHIPGLAGYETFEHQLSPYLPSRVALVLARG